MIRALPGQIGFESPAAAHHVCIGLPAFGLLCRYHLDCNWPLSSGAHVRSAGPVWPCPADATACPLSGVGHHKPGPGVEVGARRGRDSLRLTSGRHKWGGVLLKKEHTGSAEANYRPDGLQAQG